MKAPDVLVDIVNSETPKVELLIFELQDDLKYALDRMEHSTPQKAQMFRRFAVCVWHELERLWVLNE